MNGPLASKVKEFMDLRQANQIIEAWQILTPRHMDELNYYPPGHFEVEEWPQGTVVLMGRSLGGRYPSPVEASWWLFCWNRRCIIEDGTLCLVRDLIVTKEDKVFFKWVHAAPWKLADCVKELTWKGAFMELDEWDGDADLIREAKLTILAKEEIALRKEREKLEEK